MTAPRARGQPGRTGRGCRQGQSEDHRHYRKRRRGVHAVAGARARRRRGILSGHPRRNGNRSGAHREGRSIGPSADQLSSVARPACASRRSRVSACPTERPRTSLTTKARRSDTSGTTSKATGRSSHSVMASATRSSRRQASRLEQMARRFMRTFRCAIRASVPAVRSSKSMSRRPTGRLPAGRRRSASALSRKPTLKPGEAKSIEVTVDPRLLATYEAANNNWHVTAGVYRIMLGDSSDAPMQTVDVTVPDSVWSASVAAER